MGNHWRPEIICLWTHHLMLSNGDLFLLHTRSCFAEINCFECRKCDNTVLISLTFRRAEEKNSNMSLNLAYSCELRIILILIRTSANDRITCRNDTVAFIQNRQSNVILLFLFVVGPCELLTQRIEIGVVWTTNNMRFDYNDNVDDDHG